MTNTAPCASCEIVAGDSPASIVYHADTLLGFMDIQPVRRGHTLLVPKANAKRIADLPPDIGEGLLAGATRLARPSYDSLKCDGVNWHVGDGEAAGQEVSHFHLHIIPRYQGDGFRLVFPPDYNDLLTCKVAG